MVPSNPRVWAFSLGVLVALSGCASTSGPTTDPGALPEESGGSGVSGVVTDDQLVPLDGVLVTTGSSEALTAGGGQFAILGLPAGEHVLEVSAVSHHTKTLTVQVEEGVVAQVAVILYRLGSPQPYHETFVQSGMISCSGSYVAAGQNNSLSICSVFPFLGVNDIDQSFNYFNQNLMGADVTGVVIEVVWTPNNANARFMQVAAVLSNVPHEGAQPAGADGPLAVGMGASPVKLVADREGLVGIPSRLDNKSVCGDDECYLSMNHLSWIDEGAQAEAGLMVQQRFDDYVTVFHVGEFPGGSFSAFQDA